MRRRSQWLVGGTEPETRVGLAQVRAADMGKIMRVEERALF